MRRWLLAAVVVAVVGSALLTGVTQVQPGEIAVVRRLGRVLDERPRPGLYVGLPWGIDRVDRVAVDLVRRVHVGFDPRAAEDLAQRGQYFTGNTNLVNVQVVVEYTVNVDEVVDYLVHEEAGRVDPLVERVAEAALAEWVAAQTVDDVLLQGKAELPRWLNRELPERLRPYRLGIRVQRAGVTYAYPPQEVKSAFDEVNSAQNAKETAIQNALRDAGTRERDSLSEKYRIERLTAAHVAEQKALADADATAFAGRLDKYRRFSTTNPEYLNALWLDEMSRLYARMRENGRIDILDNYLGRDGLDITQFPTLPRKK